MILKYFIQLVTSYNQSFIIQREWLLYPTISYKHFMTCCNTFTNCVIIKHFFFSRYRKCFNSDIISEATFSRLPSWHSRSSLIFCHSFHITHFIRAVSEIKKKFYLIASRGQCYKTFYSCNLKIFLISYNVCP